MGKAEIDAANEIYQVAQANAKAELEQMKSEIDGIRLEAQAMGVLKKIQYDQAHNEMLKYVVLLRLRESKEYQKGGMTWEQFCEQVAGETKRNVDLKIADIRPLADNFGNFFSQIAGVPFSKIRLLGREIGKNLAQIDDGCLVVDGQRIALTPENKDEIEALIDAIKDAHKKEAEEQAATIRAKDRILEAKEKMLNKQEKVIARLEGTAEKKGLSAEEDAFIQQCLSGREALDTFLARFDPEINPLPDDATPRMRAAFMETIGYFRRVIEGTFNTAAELYGEPELDDEWIPPNLRPAEGEGPDCTTCEFHKAMSNPRKGIRIPGKFGKCTRPEGLCLPEPAPDEEG